jgi:hypothetical protein
VTLVQLHELSDLLLDRSASLILHRHDQVATFRFRLGERERRCHLVGLLELREEIVEMRVLAA